MIRQVLLRSPCAQPAHVQAVTAVSLARRQLTTTTQQQSLQQRAEEKQQSSGVSVDPSFLKGRTLSPERMAIVEATAPAVAANLNDIVNTFYPTMFKKNPETLAFFNKSNQRRGRQQEALAGSVVAAVQHLSHLEDIAKPLIHIGHKHAALGVLPEHYQIVHDRFLDATASVLGDAVTPEVADAWSGVLNHVAEACIGIEEQIYENSAARAGHWDGRKGAQPFVVDRIVEEAEDTRSLYLRPANGNIPPEFDAGQYITVCLPSPSEEPVAGRHYTLSHPEAVDGCLRITVRLQASTDGAPEGFASNWLNDATTGTVVDVRPPFGLPVLETPQQGSSHIFITGGSGVTVASGVLPASKQAGAKTAHLHVDVSPAHEPLADELAKWTDLKLQHYDNQDPAQYVDFGAKLDEMFAAGFNTQGSKATLCGPPDFMRSAYQALKAKGMAADDIHVSAFGPSVKME